MNGCAYCDFEVDQDYNTWYHAKDCPEGRKLRDSWRTPGWLCELLGKFTLDPCSNPDSLVQAETCLLLEAGDDGLTYDWCNHDVYINGPYSDLLPWAKKAATARSAVALVNHDHSTEWYRAFVKSGLLWEFKFHKRIKFTPPRHIRESTNSKPQSLLCTWNAAIRLDRALVEHDIGSWWTSRSPSVDS